MIQTGIGVFSRDNSNISDIYFSNIMINTRRCILMAGGAEGNQFIFPQFLHQKRETLEILKT